ncbi:glutamate synthase large subunit [Chrysiogenes arsenatis]|uniref:glutamate synthase large subunit n=1 Tax=Chrysiogenes arsenatis TaxID=309797 RepID=UPI00041C5428|nr:glutamate synthase large subunit [Chrysiogenes arsenatis]
MNYADDFKDSCGFGLLAHIYNKASHAMLSDSIHALSRMMHRGAVAADGKTGDGCGLLCSMPHRFFQSIATEQGASLPSQYAVAVLFLTDPERQKAVFTEYCERNDLRVLLFRDVPLNTEVLGEHALAMLPTIIQAIVVPDSIIATRRFDALLYLTRREVEHTLSNDSDFYIPSFSRRVISYKGLVMPRYLRQLYPDLTRTDFEISFALVHQRFSTNTLPKWKLAQPLRSVAHNGEINSIQANRTNATAKMAGVRSSVFSQEELQRIFPIMDKGVSDSGSLDNMFEFLIANGMDFFKAIRCLIPPPRHNVSNMAAKLRSFYEYHAGAFEPWDGPAAVSVTDGRYVGCILDRNGLRPAKYIVTNDDRLIIASEYGVLDVDPKNVRERGRLQSGQMIAADLLHGKIFTSADIDKYLMRSQPYSQWLTDHTYFLQEFIERQFEDISDYTYPNLIELQRYHNYTNEVVDLIINPMWKGGKEATGSMGDDTPIAAFSDIQRNFTDFFRQKFAQVTNPPIDPIREKTVMSTTIGFGEVGNILTETAERAKRLKTISPILSRDIFDALLSFGDTNRPRFEPCYKHAIFSTAYQGNTLHESLDALGLKVMRAVIEQGVRLIILDDRDLDAHHKIIPMAMATGFIHQALLRSQVRYQCSIIVTTGEVMDSHSAAVMLGYGATAIYPYLLYATALDMCQSAGGGRKEFRQALKHTFDAMSKGILKIMSKMGISTVSSYRNSALFDIIGLSRNVVESCFQGSSLLLPGLDFADIDERIEKIHRQVFHQNYLKKLYPLEIGGFYKHNNGWEYHDFGPKVITQIHRFAEVRTREEYIKFRDMIAGRGLKMVRDCLEYQSPNAPIPVDEVESIASICRRFDSAAMSLGALSPEAHEALAEAMNIIGGMSNSGEGGEATTRYGTIKNSKIKQIASGRFGVTPAYLRSAEEIQIKVAQGAKPGEGGQLPGEKVTPLIASLRFTIPGVTLISPPPHHDIYSIEDLAQLIFDMKQINPEARVSVKLVSTDGVGTIAAGVAKAYADKIIISGSDGGTGAAQFASIKFAGNPWEFGLSQAHKALKGNHLRGLVEVQTDGGLKIGNDVVKAALLGAESYGFGTPLLAILGCKLLRVCHLNRCTVGIATQDENLRAHYVGTVEKVVSYLENVAQDVREILASLGFRTLEDIIGHTELLRPKDDPLAQKFDFSALLTPVAGVNTRQAASNKPFDDNAFEKDVLREATPVIRNPKETIVIEREIQNVHRSFGTLLSGEIARYYGDEGLPKDAISIKLRGVAGQSLGAFLVQGVSITLSGIGNDYVGKGMNGGRIVVMPQIYRDNYSVIGNTCLYGATGGKLFASGTAGERFAVRNSGALAVVEGTGDHACEYMTGGTVVILGQTGINFGAGMTGGVAFIYDNNKSFIDRMNSELVEAKRIDVDDDNEGKLYLKKILISYHNYTRSPKARMILDNFREELAAFWMVTPKDMKAPLNPKDGD